MFNQKKYKNIFYFNESLVIETYLIGYKTEGEAILFFIKYDGGIGFSGLIDCFKRKDLDKVHEILVANGIMALDFICWTHPDYDHSKGLRQIIDNYASDKTSIWIPEGVDTSEITYSEEVRKLFEKLKKEVISKQPSLNVYSASDRKDLLYHNSTCFQKDLNIFPLYLEAYAPNSKIIRKQSYLDQFIKNDRSILFMLALGDVRILFTGDIEDGTISTIPKEFFCDHIHILKVPHHGSDSSSEIIDLCPDKCDVICSTVYRKGKNNLPLDEIMDIYRNHSDTLYCTGKFNEKDEKDVYGVVKIETDILNAQYSIILEGNAEQWKS